MKIGITLGDPSGIGPEIILKALPQFKSIDYLIFGSRKILKRTAYDLHLGKNFLLMKKRIIDCVKPVDFQYGKPTRETARAAMVSIDIALESSCDIIITPPIVKTAVKRLKSDFIGHTEYFADYYGIKNFAMVGLLGKKRIMLHTTHVPLRQVFRKIIPEKIAEKLSLFTMGLKDYFSIAKPRIGVSAFNPHAYEFSQGEEEMIKRGIDLAQWDGVLAEGPFPADSLYNRDFDGFLAMYHDQAFVYLKSKKGGLNWTLGLPVIRLSPLYGAALDIAGKNKADFSGMINAVRTGIKMYRNMKGAR
jgi:4-hydroxythreonine-4-phosphate dehydrogenase